MPERECGPESYAMMIEIIKRKKRLLLVLTAIFAVVLGVYYWQDSYFTLPPGEVKAPTEEGKPAPAAEAGFDKYDILLLGLDSRDEDPSLGSRTDTIILVTIDTAENYARILTIPRDTRIRHNGRWWKINEVYGLDGPESSCQAVEELLDTAVDRYAVVDFESVIHLVDLMDGIDVDVPVRMYKPLEGINLQPGLQHLYGEDALGYMRYRDSALSDLDRSGRQKEVVLQLVEKILQPGNLLKLPEIVNTALEYIQTDMSNQEILSLAKYGRAILSKGVENTVLPGDNALYNGGWYFVPYLTELGLPASEAEEEYRAYLAQSRRTTQDTVQAEEEPGTGGEVQGDATGQMENNGQPTQEGSADIGAADGQPEGSGGGGGALPEQGGVAMEEEAASSEASPDGGVRGDGPDRAADSAPGLAPAGMLLEDGGVSRRVGSGEALPEPA